VRDGIGKALIEITHALKLDLGEKGFNMVLKPYQIEAMKYLWTGTRERRKFQGSL